MAFTELDYVREYKNDINAFLIRAMKKVNTYTTEDLERIKTSFVKTMKYCNTILGKKAFRTIRKDGYRGRINKALFEMFSVCFSELNENQLENIQSQKEKFVEAYAALFDDQGFRSALRSGKINDCIRRMERGRMLVGEFL